ncbi:MAG: alkylphosphonate utilization protein [Phycisphaerae bacterium]|jgi:protein PhnA|nr:alkylphosphonate utilization protein [Phycisphaerae bacterium]
MAPLDGATDDWDVITKDSNGNVLQDGDSVVVIKDLDVKGAKTTIKRGTTYKKIRTTSNPEEIEVREGKSVWVLKTCFVKKS